MLVFNRKFEHHSSVGFHANEGLLFCNVNLERKLRVILQYDTYFKKTEIMFSLLLLGRGTYTCFGWLSGLRTSV